MAEYLEIFMQPSVGRVRHTGVGFRSRSGYGSRPRSRTRTSLPPRLVVNQRRTSRHRRHLCRSPCQVQSKVGSARKSSPSSASSAQGQSRTSSRRWQRRKSSSLSWTNRRVRSVTTRSPSRGTVHEPAPSPGSRTPRSSTKECSACTWHDSTLRRPRPNLLGL